jgi:hypothetical protein
VDSGKAEREKKEEKDVTLAALRIPTRIIVVFTSVSFARSQKQGEKEEAPR